MTIAEKRIRDLHRRAQRASGLENERNRNQRAFETEAGRAIIPALDEIQRLRDEVSSTVDAWYADVTPLRAAVAALSAQLAEARSQNLHLRDGLDSIIALCDCDPNTDEKLRDRIREYADWSLSGTAPSPPPAAATATEQDEIGRLRAALTATTIRARVMADVLYELDVTQAMIDQAVVERTDDDAAALTPPDGGASTGQEGAETT